MPRKITIYKPTHKFFGPGGTPALAIGQLRGDLLYLNRFDASGKLIEKSWAVGTCAHHLTGYGKGVKASETNSRHVSNFESAWRFTFGADIPAPVLCEVA